MLLSNSCLFGAEHSVTLLAYKALTKVTIWRRSRNPRLERALGRRGLLKAQHKKGDTAEHARRGRSKPVPAFFSCSHSLERALGGGGC